MNVLQLLVLLFTALSACCHGNASPTRLGYIATSGSTCASAGHTSGCCVSIQSQQADCYVEGGRCFCDAGCHQFGDCCSDIGDIQCLNPVTCQSLGLSPGCCNPSLSSCYVPQATCYCDPSCHTNGDCCTDVTITQCPARTQRVSMRVENIMRAQKARELRARHRQSSSEVARYRDAVASRVQNPRG